MAMLIGKNNISQIKETWSDLFDILDIDNVSVPFSTAC